MSWLWQACRHVLGMLALVLGSWVCGVVRAVTAPAAGAPAAAAAWSVGASVLAAASDPEGVGGGRQQDVACAPDVVWCGATRTTLPSLPGGAQAEVPLQVPRSVYNTWSAHRADGGSRACCCINPQVGHRLVDQAFELRMAAIQPHGCLRAAGGVPARQLPGHRLPAQLDVPGPLVIARCPPRAALSECVFCYRCSSGLHGPCHLQTCTDGKQDVPDLLFSHLPVGSHWCMLRSIGCSIRLHKPG